MTTIFCSKKLVEKVGLGGLTRTAAPTRLGSWHATLVPGSSVPLVLAVSEQTYLPVLLPLDSPMRFLQELSEAVRRILMAMSIPHLVASGESDSIASAHVAHGESSGALGPMEEYVGLANLLPEASALPFDTSLRLAQIPFGGLNMRSAQVATLHVLTSSPGPLEPLQAVGPRRVK